MKKIVRKIQETLEKTSLRFIFLALVLLTVICVGGISVFFSGQLVFNSKLVDAKTIQYLQLERTTDALLKNITSYSAILKKGLSNGLNVSQSLLESQGDHLITVSGSMPPKIHKTHFGGLLEESSLYNFFSLQGRTFLAVEVAKKCADSILDSDIPIDSGCEKNYRSIGSNTLRSFVFTELQSDFFGSNGKGQDSSKFFVSNNFGQLVYSNSKEVQQANLIEKELVQTFIKNNLQYGYKVFQEGGSTVFGLYRQISNTNLVSFFEFSGRQIFSIAYRALTRVLLIVLVTMMIVSIIVILATNAFLTPLEQLYGWSRRFQKGEFGLRLRPSGVGEIRKLGERFMGMADGIQQREQSIIKLMEEQKEKVKLESELAITETIQENFLPNAKISPKCPFQIHATYVAAEKASGDWYHFNYDEEREITVVVVADVSGHGVGSAMYTACIAAIYRDYWQECSGDFNPVQFSHKVHRIFAAMAGGKWHATMVVLIHEKQDDFVTLVNNGHVFPIFFKKDAKNKVTHKRPHLPSHVCGIHENFDNKPVKLGLEKGNVLLLYTDGIIEANNPKGRQYGIKKMMKSVENIDRSTKDISNSIIKKWSDFTQGEPQEDDICLLVLKKKI